MCLPQWPQQTQLVDPHATSHMVPDYHAQASPDCNVSCIPVAVLVPDDIPLVHDDIPIAKLLDEGDLLNAIPSADDIMAELIMSFITDLQRCESYDSISSGSSCSTPGCFSSNTSDSEDSSHQGSSRSRAWGQLSAAKTELTKNSRPKSRILLTANQKPILEKYKDSKKLVMPDAETYQGEYVPKGPELEDLTRRTGLTASQVRSSLQTAALSLD